MTEPIVALDLFAGAGGWDLAAHRLGIIPHGVENMPEAIATREAAGFSTIFNDVWDGLRDETLVPDYQLGIASPPCFAAGTPVLTKRGAIPIEQVVIGDEVLTHMHRWRAVTDTMTRQADTIRIGPVVTTTDHPFYYREKVREWDNSARRYIWDVTEEPEAEADRWIHAGHSRGAFFGIPQQVPWDDTEPWAGRDARIAGRYVADGWVGRDGICIAVGDNSPEPPGDWVQTSTGEHCRRFTSSEHEFGDWLADNFGSGAVNKTLPAWVTAAPEWWKRELLAGYLEGDGTVTSNGWTANTVSQLLASQLRLLAVNLGYQTSISKVATPDTAVIEGRTVNQRDYYSVHITRTNPSKCYTRDKDGFRWVKQRFVPVPNGEQTVYDLTVDEDHSFNAWGWPVHNCQTFSVAGNGSGRRALDEVLKLIEDDAYKLPGDGLRLAATEAGMDDRTALVLAPLAYFWRDRPTFIALEQVPAVLPVWHAYAEVLEGIGYSVAVANLHAEQYGVPQTRKRAILVARNDGKEARLPEPTHSRYHSRSPKRLDEGVLPWVSMAEALGWGAGARPYPTLAGGGTDSNGADPALLGGSGARRAVYSERAGADWHNSTDPDNNSGIMRLTEGEAGVLQTFPPYPEPDKPHRFAETMEMVPEGGDWRDLPDEVAQEVMGAAYSNTAGGRTSYFRRLHRDKPSPTIMGSPDQKSTLLWHPTENRPISEEEAATMQTFPPHPGWGLTARPAVAVGNAVGRGLIGGQGAKDGVVKAMEAGDFIDSPHGDGSSYAERTRITVPEAGVLQTFQHGFPFQGGKGKRFLQIGNAIPVLLAQAVLVALVS